MPKNNVVGWFEIPVTNMNRAIKFYEKVFAIKLQREKVGILDMAWFPWSTTGKGSAGSLVYNKKFYQPSAKGILIYFTALSGDVAKELSRVRKAGGKVIMPKKLITKELGHMAVFLDSEGNKIALHSKK